MVNRAEKKADFFVPTQCLFCQQSDDRVLYPARLHEESFTGYTFSARRKRKREHYQIVLCKKCSLVRSDPIIREERLQQLYSESKFIFSEEAPYAAYTYISLLKKLRDTYRAEIQSLLEIGCSTGFFLEEAIKIGINNIMGFEPSLDCYQHAEAAIKARIINDIYKPELVGDKTFDLICSFHVFDHLRDPKAALQSMTTHLNPKGYVLLVCHDVESWSAKLLHSHNPMFDIEHIYLFSKKTLAMLLESVGLRCVEVASLANTYPLGYWLRMLPVPETLTKIIPESMRKIPTTLKPGNFYIWGQKDF